jgi:hypothetical protein
VDESVLHRLIGGATVMRAQLKHIVRVAELPNVTVQILPYTAGAHPALGSTFSILELTDPAPTVIYSEGLVGQFYLQGPQDIDRYEHVFDYIRTISLNPSDSIDLLVELIAASKVHES